MEVRKIKIHVLIEGEYLRYLSPEFRIIVSAASGNPTDSIVTSLAQLRFMRTKRFAYNVV